MEALEERVVPAGTWGLLSNVPPSGANTLILLSDGTVLAHGGSGNASKSFFKLTPDATGSYQNGTWTTVASSNTGRLYAPEALLPDGRVFMYGGEYTLVGGSTTETDVNSGEIYDPIANTWTPVASIPGSLDPSNNYGDDPLTVLNNGTVFAGYIFDARTFIYNPGTNSWSLGGMKLNGDRSDEEGWVKLPDGSILSYDVFSSISSGTAHAQRYIPSTNTWVATSNLPAQLSSSADGFELGPGLLLPDGRAFYLGTEGNTAYYTPGTNSWAAGPSIPGGLGSADAPAAVLPNGDVLLAAAPTLSANGGNFVGPTKIFELNPLTNVYTDVTPSLAGFSLTSHSFVNTMLVLPTGQVLLTNDGGHIAIYTESGTPVAAAIPTVSGITNNGGNFTLAGLGLTGINEGAAYGDDLEMASNYPLVQLTNGAGIVSYARTFGWSTTQVATGLTPVTTNFAAATPGPYLLAAIVNGIASNNALFVEMGTGADNITLRLDPGNTANIQVLQNGNTLLGEFSLSSFTTIDVNGTGALTVDFSNGAFGVPVTFNGSGTSTLTFADTTSVNTLVYDATAADAGDFVVNGDTANKIVFSGVQTTQETAVVSSLTLNVDPNNAISGLVNTTFTAAGANSTETLDNSLASLTFANPTAALVVNGHAANDNITFTSLGTGYYAPLTVSGGGGTDTVTVNMALSLGFGVVTGSASITATNIVLGASISADAGFTGGPIALTGNVSLTTDVSLKYGGTNGLTIGGGTVSLGTHALTVSDSAPSDTGSIGGVISGSGNAGGDSLIETSRGALTLGAANTYTGNTHIVGGTLRLGAANGVGSGSDLIDLGTFDLHGFDDTVGGFNGNQNGVVTNSGSGTGTNTLTVGAGLANIFAGVIKNGATAKTALTVSGTGVFQTLTGANTYTGATTIGAGATLTIGTNGGTTGSLAATSAVADSGTLQFFRGDATSFGNAISGAGGINVLTGTVTLTTAESYTGLTAIQSGATLRLGIDNAVGGSSTVSDSGTFDLNGHADTIATLTGTGTVTNNGTSLGTLTVTAAGTFSGTIKDGAAAATALSVGGTGEAFTFTLANANTYTGNTGISNGNTLLVGATNAVGTGSNLFLSGGTFDLNGFDDSVAGLNGTGTVTNGAAGTGTNTLTAASGIFGGVIQDGTTAHTALTVSGSGTSLALTGANTYTGPTTINSGADLVVGTGGATGSLAGGTAITDNGVLDLGRNATYSFGNSISGAGVVSFDFGTVTLTTAESYTGQTVIAGAFGGATVKAGVTNAVASSTLFSDNGTFDLNGFDNTVQLLNGSGTVTNSAVGTGSNTLTDSGGGGSTFFGVIQGGITAQTGLAVSGSNTDLFLAGADTYSGATTIDPGAQLDIGNGGATGSLAAGTPIADNGTLEFDHSAATSFGNAITGSGGVSILQSTVTLTTAETYSGPTSIPSGATLVAGVTDAVGSNSSVSVAGTFDLAGFDDTIGALTGGGTVTNSGAGTGTNTLTVTASGTYFGVIQDGSTAKTALTVGGTGATLTLANANTYTGTTTIDSTDALVLNAGDAIGSESGVVDNGTLDMGNPSQGGFDDTIDALSGSGVVTNSGPVIVSTLTVGGNGGSGTFAGVIQDGTGAGLALDKVGAGTETLTGANTYSQGTTVSAGILLVDNTAGSGTGSGGVNVLGGSLGGTGTIAGPVSLFNATTLSPGDPTAATTTGILSTGGLDPGSSSTLNVGIGGNTLTPTPTYDQIDVTSGSVTLDSATLSLTLVGVFVPKPGDVYTIIANNTGTAPVGTFLGLPEGGLASANLFNSGLVALITYQGGASGHDVAIEVEKPVPPSIGSANATTFMVGTPGTFTVSTTATPTAAIAESRALPGGVTFTDNGHGTATLAGNPNPGTGGTYTFTITAKNGFAPDATQTFTLTVNEAPTVTSGTSAAFTVGTSGTFTVRTAHDFPVATTLIETGALPGGVGFTDNGNGTATLSGYPNVGTGGTYTFSIKASNGVSPDATQTFTLTVNEAGASSAATARRLRSARRARLP